MRCETCRSGADDRCNSWAPCATGIAHERAESAAVVRLEYHAEAAVNATERLAALAEAGPRACRRCGAPLPPVEVGYDEEQNAVVAVAECRCGSERPQAPLTAPELRAWVRGRLAVVRQRRAS